MKRTRAVAVSTQAVSAAAPNAVAAMKALEEGTPLASIASTHQLPLNEPGSLRRDAEGTPRALLDAAFKLPRPMSGKTSVGQAELAKGEIAVIALTEVRDATPITDDSSFKQQTTQLKDALAGAEFVSFRADLERRLGVDRKSLPAVDAADAPAP